MKNLLTLTLILMIGSFSCKSQSGDVFVDMYKNIQEDFNSRDAKAFSSHFSERVNFISPMGMHCATQECVYEGHKTLFEMWGPATAKLTNDLKVLQSFSLGKDYHLLSLDSKLTGGEETPHHQFTFIFEREGSGWKVVSAQLTPVIKRF